MLDGSDRSDLHQPLSAVALDGSQPGYKIAGPSCAMACPRYALWRMLRDERMPQHLLRSPGVGFFLRNLAAAQHWSREARGAQCNRQSSPTAHTYLSRFPVAMCAVRRTWRPLGRPHRQSTGCEPITSRKGCRTHSRGSSPLCMPMPAT